MSQKASDEVLSRVLGKTTSDEPLFTPRDDSGSGTYVRNLTGILSSDNMTAISVYNDSADARQTATLVSPRHVIMANHYFPANGTVFRFVTAGNVVVTRTLSNSSRADTSDVQVGVLDSDVPGTLSFFKVMTAADVAKLSARTMVFFLDQSFNVHIAGRADTIAGSINLGGNLNGDTYLPSSLSSFFIEPSGGDSSHPIFAIIDNQVILLATLHGVTYGDSLSGQYVNINSAMTSLGGGYQLTAFTSGYYR